MRKKSNVTYIESMNIGKICSFGVPRYLILNRPLPFNGGLHLGISKHSLVDHIINNRSCGQFMSQDHLFFMIRHLYSRHIFIFKREVVFCYKMYNFVSKPQGPQLNVLFWSFISWDSASLETIDFPESAVS